MTARRVYPDASLLIAAWDSDDASNASAQAVLADPGADFLCTSLVRLEVLPSAMAEGREEERDFYEHFFSQVAEWHTVDERTIEEAFRLASRYGVRGLDAMHAAAAIRAGAEEFVTAERATKPLFRIPDIRMRSIR